MGPLIVIDVAGDAYTVQHLNDASRMYKRHVTFLKPYRFDHNVSNEAAAAMDDATYFVDKIVNHRGAGGKSKYRTWEYEVKWSGYDETTWEPYKQIKKLDRLQEYLINQGIVQS